MNRSRPPPRTNRASKGGRHSIQPPPVPMGPGTLAAARGAEGSLSLLPSTAVNSAVLESHAEAGDAVTAGVRGVIGPAQGEQLPQLTSLSHVPSHLLVSTSGCTCRWLTVPDRGGFGRKGPAYWANEDETVRL
jgi:hypothetical protein